MIWVLKIILALIAIANVFIFRFVTKDFNRVRKSEGYDNLSVWEKMRFSSVFYFILMALLSLFIFLVYFVIIPIQIGNV
jgi:hypothetical protein